MPLKLPEKLKELAFSRVFPLYVVGGTVREYLTGAEPAVRDLDICAPVSAEKFCCEAEKYGAEIMSVYRNTGTVKLKFGGEECEFASFRSDEYVRGMHTPVNTFFTDDINLDARRRDFRCNAVYYDIAADEFADPLGGLRDIEEKKLAPVADADKVFGEDGLRLMRLARQAAQTGFSPTDECLCGARRNRSLISDVSAERIYAELGAILHADGKYGIKHAQLRGLEILDAVGVLDIILPEVAAGRGIIQRSDYHSYDVLGHSMRAVMYADESIRWAALLHDTGKPVCMSENGNCHGHEKVSAEIASDIMRRLRAPVRLANETSKLCALHMYDTRCDARESKVRRFIVRNYAVLEKLLALKQADYSACRDDTDVAPCVAKWRKIEEKMKSEGAPFTLRQLEVRGNELIGAGISPDKTGKTLLKLLDECAMNPALNEKERLINLAVNMNRGEYNG